MEGLLFQMGLIWNATSFSIISLFIALLTGGLLFLYWRKRYNTVSLPKAPIQENFTFSPINPGDPLFVEHTLEQVRHYLHSRYPTKHVWAHTSNDIAKYCNSTDILTSLLSLERSEYAGLELSTREANELNQTLTRVLV